MEICIHQQNGRAAVALGVNFGLWTMFPNLLRGCVTVAILWDTWVLECWRGRIGKTAETLWYRGGRLFSYGAIRELPMPENLDLANATRPFHSFPLQ